MGLHVDITIFAKRDTIICAVLYKYIILIFTYVATTTGHLLIFVIVVPSSFVVVKIGAFFPAITILYAWYIFLTLLFRVRVSKHATCRHQYKSCE